MELEAGDMAEVEVVGFVDMEPVEDESAMELGSAKEIPEEGADGSSKELDDDREMLEEGAEGSVNIVGPSEKDPTKELDGDGESTEALGPVEGEEEPTTELDDGKIPEGAAEFADAVVLLEKDPTKEPDDDGGSTEVLEVELADVMELVGNDPDDGEVLGSADAIELIKDGTRKEVEADGFEDASELKEEEEMTGIDVDAGTTDEDDPKVELDEAVETEESTTEL